MWSARWPLQVPVTQPRVESGGVGPHGWHQKTVLGDRRVNRGRLWCCHRDQGSAEERDKVQWETRGHIIRVTRADPRALSPQQPFLCSRKPVGGVHSQEAAW